MKIVAVDLREVLLTALLNPVVVVVAVWMGRNATQWQKVPIAAFAAAFAGTVLLYILARLRLFDALAVAPAAAGVFTAQFLLGLIWASIAYRWLGRRTP